MIFQGSRYEKATVVAVQSRAGWVPTVFRTMPHRYLTAEMVLDEHETLQSIAARAYGDAELWWHIADANPQYLYPDRIPAGSVIKVPYASTLR